MAGLERQKAKQGLERIHCQQVSTDDAATIPEGSWDLEARRSDRIESASADIRNALVPLRTIAEILRRPYDAESRDWCVRMLEIEVKRIVEILDRL